MNKKISLNKVFSLLLVIIISVIYWNIVFAKSSIIFPSNTTSLKNKTASIVDENNKNYNWILVKYKDWTINKSSIDATITSNWLELQEEITWKGISLLKIKDKNSSIDKIIKNLKSDWNFKVVQPNYLYSIDSIDSNDTYKDNLWGLYNFWQNIESQAWTIWKDISFDKTIKIFSWTTYLWAPWQTIAIIDSGVAYNHPDLINRMWDWTNCKDENWNYLGWCIHGYDFYSNDKNPQWEYESHWTHIAWIISWQMNNWIWWIWVNPNSKIMAIKTWEESFSTVEIIKWINFAKENWAKIINASFWYNWWTYWVDKLLYDSIQSFTDAGWLFIAAAWNDWYNTDILSNRFFPAAFKSTNYTDSDLSLTWTYISWWYIFTWITNIISVAASDNQDNKASFSNYWIETVDIWAPWKSIYSSVLWTINIFNQNLTWSTLSVATWWINFNWWINWYWYFRTDLNYPYWTWTESYIEKQVDISSVNAPSLNFSLWCDAWSSLSWLDDYSTDYLKLSFSTWWSFSDYAKYNYTSSKLPYYTSWWYYNNFSIPIKNYKSSNFKFRFTWHTDNISDTDNWCFIYNSLKIDWKDNWELNTYEYKNWTSMATPYVAWLTSLLWSYKPTLTWLDIKNAILLNWDDVLSMSWTTTTWKRINSYKSILSLMTLWNISWFKGYTNTWKTQLLSTWIITSTRNPYFEWSDDVWQEALSGYILNMSDQSWTIFPTITTKNKYYTWFIIPADWIYKFSIYEELLNWNTWAILNSWDFNFDITWPNKLTNLYYPTFINKLNYQNFYISWSWDLIDSWSLIELTLSWSNLSKTYSWFLQWESFSFSWINTTTINDWNISLILNIFDWLWNKSDDSTWTTFKKINWPTWSINFSSWVYVNNYNTKLNLISSETWTYLLTWTWLSDSITWSIINNSQINVTLTWSDWQKTINYLLTDIYWNDSQIYTTSTILDTLTPTITNINYSSWQYIYSSSITLTWVVLDTNIWTWIQINSINTPLTSTWYFFKTITLTGWLNHIDFYTTDLAWNEISTWINLIYIWQAPKINAYMYGIQTIKFDFENDLAWTWYLLYWTWDLTNISTWTYGKNNSITIPYTQEETTYYYKWYTKNDEYNSIYTDTWSIKTPKNVVLNETWSLTFTWNINVTDSTWTWIYLSWTWNIRIYNYTWDSFIDIPKSDLSILSASWNWDGIIEAPHKVNSYWTIEYGWYTRQDLLTYKIWSNTDWLIFTWWQVQVSLYVWTSYNWKILRIYNSEDNQNTFSYISDCLVSYWKCNFKTTKFSEFAILSPTVADSTPDNFTFPSITEASLKTEYKSNTLIITGMNTSTGITASVWTLVINWVDSWASWTVNSWSTIAIKLTSSSLYSNSIISTISLWWYTTTFTVTTKNSTSWWWGGGWWWVSSTTTTIKTSSTWSVNTSSLLDTINLEDNDKQLQDAENTLKKTLRWQKFIKSIDLQISKLDKNKIEKLLKIIPKAKELIKNNEKYQKDKLIIDKLNYLESKLYLILYQIKEKQYKIDATTIKLNEVKDLLSQTERWKILIQSFDIKLQSMDDTTLSNFVKSLSNIKTTQLDENYVKYMQLKSYLEVELRNK